MVSVDKVQGLQLKTMNKENIKHFSDSSDFKSLRLFRIRKHVVYQELSSDSDSDSKRTCTSDNDDNGVRNKKIRSESSHTTNDKTKTKPHHFSSTSSFNNLNDNQKDKACLSSEEISVILSEFDEKPDNNQEKREKLHSIENVSMVNDSKEKASDHTSLSLKLNFICSVCNLEFQSLDDLQRHESSHKRSTFSATSHQTVESHSVQDSQEKSIQRPLNSFVSSKNKSDFLDTFKNHILSKGLVSPKRKSLSKKDHKIEKEFHKRKIFVCDFCNYYSSKILKFKTHQILFHSLTTDLKCDYCNYETSICVNLATHMKDHLLDCPHCNYQCLGSINFNAHMKRFHLNFKCTKCDFTCDTQRKLSWHLKKHILIEKFKCEHCKSAFSLKVHLKKHIEKHCVQSKAFKCDQCEKCFSHKNDLKFHIRSHKELFTCDICKRTFVHKSFLRLHLQWHDKDSFKCNKCNSNFSRKRHLKLHMLTHKSKDNGTGINDTSKHICIDKLYDVQKRSLNFTRENSEIKGEVNSNITGETEKHIILNKRSSASELKTDKNKITKFLNSGDSSGNQKQVEKIVNKIDSSENKKQVERTVNNSDRNILLNNGLKININNVKLSSLRQNLPSRTNRETVYKSEKINGNLQHVSKKRGNTIKVISKKIRNKKTVPKTRGDYAYLSNSKKNSLISKNNHFIKVKRSNHMKQLRLRKHYLLKDLDCMKVIFSKKTSLSNLLVDPVRFVAGRYVECYYQSQPTSTPPFEHLERHLRQRSLLSCRFCHYKTNSQHLLQRHTAETHTWDRAVVNTLFS